MMLTKKIKFENSLYFLFNIIIFICGLINLINNDIIIGVIAFTFSIILASYKILLLNSNSNKKPERIMFIINIILTIVVITICIIINIKENIDLINNLDRKPNSTDTLSLRLTYICINSYKSILKGLFTTLWLSLSGTVVGLLIALVFIYIKTIEDNPNDSEFKAFLKSICKTLVNVYVTVFRGTPMMVQAIIIFYFLPGVLAGIFNVDINIINKIMSIEVCGFITVTLNTTAYLTEVLRGGIESLNNGQMEGARSLGMTRHQAMKYVILPQAIKNSLPSICNEFIINIKDTSVLSVISVMDLFFVIDSINKRNASQDGIFISAAIYLILTLGISKILQVIEKKLNLEVKSLPSCN